MKCHVCFRHCDLQEGQRGFCRARINKDNKIIPENYGVISSIALDPIEKKPLNRFYPGSFILSLGSYGCNLRCPFCQNHEISQTGDRGFSKADPEEIRDIALREKVNGNIGVAYTYNEALTGYEFVRDTAKLIHEEGMKNVLVSNGMAELQVLKEILPYIDAMNIDLKSFSEEVYRDVLMGDLRQTMDFIEEAAKHCHMEITTLVVPGINDSEEEIREIAKWIAGLNGGREEEIPYHLSRFFPQYKMTDRGATPVDTVYALTRVAGEYLKYVYAGNV
ncbi:MAG: AmmeMemoRadiSam system radical SAM enzyme [Lachnospiraceae bacterium]|nr:AmmeMemoRadiSam system radical SAM enzyme [Lachnospiraceae bacterium]